MPPLHGHALWLIPDTESGEFLSEIIIRLAKKYKSCIFVPHITLAGVPGLPINRLTTALSEIAGQSSPFSFNPEQVKCGDYPYQKLTLMLDKPGEFLRMCDYTDLVMKGNFSKKANPHVSVLYGRVLCDELMNEPHGIEIVNIPEIKIEKVALVSLNGSPEEWKIEASEPL